MRIFQKLKSILNQHSRIIRDLGYGLSIITLLLIILGLTGQIIRDPTVKWGLFMYIPLLPLGIWAVMLDILYLGRSLPKIRFGLTVIGLCVVIFASLSMIGFAGITTRLSDNHQQISLLHWNVRWGGRNWQSIRQDIYQRHPDIIVISEPPNDRKLSVLLKQMGPHWTMVKVIDTMVVMSAWPLQFQGLTKLRKGKGMLVGVTVHDYPLRILVVDGSRNVYTPWVIFFRAMLPRWRTPFLRDVVKTVAQNAKMGTPIDIIAGDFNALSRSLGFTAMQQVAGGYNLAGQFAEGQWRGTWLSWLPLYDIDHVWVHTRFQNLNTDFVTNFTSDHRGQLVHFDLP